MRRGLTAAARRRPPPAARRSFSVGSCCFCRRRQGQGSNTSVHAIQSENRNYLCVSSASYIHQHQQINFNSESRMKRKSTTKIDSFFKPIASSSNATENANPPEEQPVVDDTSSPNPVDMQTDDQNIVAPLETLEEGRTGSTKYVRDPGTRQQIWELHPDKQDEARRFYVSKGAFQPYMREYPYNGTTKNRRRFQYSYFTDWPWLEYSLVTHHAYCFYCFLFTKKPTGKCGSSAFTVDGFINWRKVNDGKDCAFITHMGKDSNSAHSYSARCYENLKNRLNHIDKVMVQVCTKKVADARLRLKVTIDSIRWLTFQACPFRGHDESPGSLNQGNFLELVKLLAAYNKDVRDVVLENAPQNAKYTSHPVQQLVELNDRFSVQSTELLRLCVSLNPLHDTFDVTKICTLAEKFYPADFSNQDLARLESQLIHFKMDVCSHPDLKCLHSLADLTVGLFKTGKVRDYSMVDRLLRLVITLPVSTATTERAFSAMKLVKTRLRGKMGDDFLRHYMVVYIGKEIAAKVTSDEIIHIFDDGTRRAEFQLIEM